MQPKRSKTPHLHICSACQNCAPFLRAEYRQAAVKMLGMEVAVYPNTKVRQKSERCASCGMVGPPFRVLVRGSSK